jgi:iron complex outermembrane receptor protein
MNADRYRYIGTYPQDPGAAYTDKGSSQGLGGEAMFLWDPASNHRLTLGTEFRHITQALYLETQVDGSITQDDAPYDLGSLFVQSEFQLHPQMSLMSGLRLDQKSGRRATLAPRVALLVSPDKATTVKLLFGEAFRSPSVAEADINTSFYTENTALRPERIRTLELEMQRRVAAPLLFTASLFDYKIRNLIEQVEFIPNGGGLEYRNVASAHARGAELEVDLQPAGPIGAQAVYTIQAAHDETSQERMTNSPSQISRLTLRSKLAPGLRSSATVRYESGRRTLAGTSTSAFVRTDMSLLYAAGALGDWARGADLSLRVSNVFNREYASPGGVEHLQTSIPADGRALSLALHWRY